MRLQQLENDNAFAIGGAWKTKEVNGNTVIVSSLLLGVKLVVQQQMDISCGPIFFALVDNGRVKTSFTCAWRHTVAAICSFTATADTLGAGAAWESIQTLLESGTRHIPEEDRGWMDVSCIHEFWVPVGIQEPSVPYPPDYDGDAEDLWMERHGGR